MATTVRNPETWQGYESRTRIEELLEEGVTVTAIARRFGKSRTAIYDVLNKEKAGASNNDSGQSSTPATSASDLSEPTIPGATGGESL